MKTWERIPAVKLTPIYQDGGAFYNAINHKLLADYSELVNGGFDIVGAMKARSIFLSEFGENYSFEV